MWKLHLILFIFLSARVSACTDFLLLDNQNQAVVGRSMEFGIELEPQIIYYPKEQRKTSRIKKDEKGLSWTSLYAFTAVTAFQEEIVTDGVNEAGLSFGLLWFPDITDYPLLKKGEDRQTIALRDLGSWILGSFANVEEVKAALEQVQLWPHTVPKIGSIPPIHLAIHDRSGKSIVVEYIKGKTEISDNPVSVLTNTPKFSWQITNLGNYLNLSSISESPLQLDRLKLHPLGLGSGLLGIPGDWTSPSRFVRMVTFKHIIAKARNIAENVNSAFHLLNTVDIPFGAVKSEDGNYTPYTQWVVVKDLTKGTLYYRSYVDLNIKEVRFETGSRIKKTPLN